VFGFLSAVPLQRFLAEHLPPRCPSCGSGVRSEQDTCPCCLAPLSANSPTRRSILQYRAPSWIRDRTR
jgi:predicted amidophosphoribosyltransferase